MAFRFATITNREISQINSKKNSVPVNMHEEGDEIRFGSFTGKQVKLCQFNLNLSLKPVNNGIFCLQMQIKSCVTLFAWSVHK